MSRGRRGLRARWIPLVVQSKAINGETRALLLYLATRMTDAGAVEFVPGHGTWDDLAHVFGVHRRRIAERFRAAQDAQLIAKVSGGWNGSPAVWQALLTDPKTVEFGAVEAHQTSGVRCGLSAPKIRTKLSGDSPEFGAVEAHPMTRALLSEGRERDDHERNVGVERDDVQPQERAERRAPARSLVAALSPSSGRRLACAGLRPRTEAA